MAVVVTVTQPAVTVTATSTSHPSSSLTAGDIAGIVIGTLLGCILLVALVFYLRRRYRRHKFTRVPNPPLESVAPRGAPCFPSIRPKASTSHSKKPSASSDPLMAPLSWPPIPLTSRVHSPGAPPRSDSVSPGQLSIGEVNHVTVSHSTMPAISNVPPVRIPDQKPPSPKPSPLFVHRALQSRARASDFVSLAHNPSFDSIPSPSPDSPTLHVDVERLLVDVERLLADAERNALRDVEMARKEDDDVEQRSTSESVYSQLSAPHSLLPSPVTRQNTLVSVGRRKSSRRQPPIAELPPVTEVPDTPRARSDTLSIGPNSSLDAQVSHGTVSRPISSVFEESGPLPLLTSVNFGKESGTTVGSITSTAGWASNSSGRASRYPSLAPSSIGRSDQSSSRSDGGTDWRHLPPGLSGLKTLQVGPLRNPHSPVEERREVASGDGRADKRAHLRQSTASSVAEVERRPVVGGGIARIDVVF